MKKLIAFIVCLMVLGGAYIAAWQWMKKVGDAALARLVAQAPDDGVIYNGTTPVIEGFPFVPYITLTQGIRIDDWQASFPSMRLRGFPVPGMPITASFPDGAIAWEEGAKAPVALDALEVTARIPWPLPKSIDGTGLRAWRDDGGSITVTDSLIRYEGMETRMAGTISLDDALQPQADMTARTKGYAAFIQTMIEDEKIQPFAGIALIAALNNFAQPDPDAEDGEMIAALPVTVQNRGLYVGPVLVETFREIVWDKRNSPALHQ